MYIILLIETVEQQPTKAERSKSGNMTSSGETGLKLRANGSPQLDRTRYPEVLCWLAAFITNVYGNLSELVIRPNSVTRSRVNEMCDQLTLCCCIWSCPRMVCDILERET